MRYVTVIGGAVSALAITMASAQEPSSATPEASEDDQDLITVYATSNPLPTIDYPGQVSVIDRREIDARMVSTVSDALRDVPGLQFNGGPRRTGEVPVLRGLSRENVLVLLDGARQSFLSAHDGRFFLEPDLVSRAEVVRGPASALYGSGAVGGVLAFETAKADDFLDTDETLGTRFRAGYQSVNDETSGTLTIFGRSDKLDALASFTLRHSGDIRLGSGADLPSDDDIASGLVKLGYKLSDALTVEGSWQRLDSEVIEPNNGQGTNGLDDGLVSVKKDIVTDTYRLSASVNPRSDLVDARVIAYRTETSLDEFDRTVPQLLTRLVETNGISARNASRFKIGGVDLTATIGADWFEDEQVGTDDMVGDRSRRGVPDGSASFIGVFGQLEAMIDRPFGLPGEFFIVPGIRYDAFENDSVVAGAKNEDDAISPRLAASYGPTEWLRVFGSYAKGFRAPSLNELYLDGVHFNIPHPILFNPTARPPSFVFVPNNFIPNPDLKPEETSTTEFGLALDFADILSKGDKLQAKVSRFDSDIENLINLAVDLSFDPTCFGPPFFPCTAGTTESSNIDDATIQGIELEARYDSDGLYTYLSWSQIEGTNTSNGADLGTLVPDRLAIDIGYRIQNIGAVLGARLQLADRFRRRDRVDGELEVVEERDDFAVLDLYTTWSPSFLPNIRVDLGVDNVADENYERVFEGVSEPGRNVKFSIGYQLAY